MFIVPVCRSGSVTPYERNVEICDHTESITTFRSFGAWMSRGLVSNISSLRDFSFQQSPVASGGLLAVNHPRNPESIYAHAEARRPERLLNRHLHGSVLCL